MRPLTPADVLPLDDYLAVREAVRTRARAARDARRVAVGDRIALAFENRETVLFQVQEMVRVEEIRDPEKLAEEVRIYNDLVAGEAELRATFFVEITDRVRIKDDLDSLIGLEQQGLFLVVEGEPVAAEFEPGHAREDRISAVHFVRFPLTPGQRDRIRAGTARLEVLVDHPTYQARVEVGEATRAALALDLGGGVTAPAPGRS